MKLARTVAASVLVGTLSATLVGVASIAMAAPRFWPGVLIAFFGSSAGMFLCLTAGKCR